MYLAQITRHHVMYTPCQLARAMSKPGKVCMGAAKHLLRYFAGTRAFSITYKQGGFKVSGFSDANWGSSPDNRKSTSAYLIMMYQAAVGFDSRIHSLAAMSTTEAELLASALTMKEAMFYSNTMTELSSGQQVGQVPMHMDNTATLHVIGNQRYSSRTKHIDSRFFYIRELVEEGKITIHYIPTQSQFAHIGPSLLTSIFFVSYRQDQKVGEYMAHSVYDCFLHRSVFKTASTTTTV